MKVAPFALVVALVAAAGTAAAQPEDSRDVRLGANVSGGVVTTSNSAAGSARSLGLGAELVIGHAALRLEIGKARYDGFERSDDRRAAMLLSFDVVDLPIGGSVSAVPFIEGGGGFTGTRRFENDHRDWRPHLEGGGGLRLEVGARLSLSARFLAGVRRDTQDLFVALAPDGPTLPPEPGREHYRMWRASAALYY